MKGKEYPEKVLLQHVVSCDVAKVADQVKKCAPFEINYFGVLHAAAKIGNDAIMELILATHLDVNFNFDDNETALHAAVEWDRTSVAIMLLRAGADVNHVNDDGYSVLHYAIMHQREYLLTLFLSGELGGAVEGEAFNLNANVNLCARGLSPLMLAIKTENINIVNLLLKFKTSINCTSISPDFLSAIHYSIEVANSEILQLLLNSGASINNYRNETTDILDFLVRAWKKMQEVNSTKKSKELQKCAEILLFYGAGIGIRLPAELLEMNLNLQRCCLFNATMQIPTVVESVMIDVDLRNKFPGAIHTIFDLAVEYSSELASRKPLPYKHLLECVDVQLGLRGRDDDARELFPVRSNLYRRAPSAEGGIALWGCAVFSAKREGKLNELAAQLRKPNLPEAISNEMALMSHEIGLVLNLPDLNSPSRSLRLERETFFRVQQFRNHIFWRDKVSRNARNNIIFRSGFFGVMSLLLCLVGWSVLAKVPQLGIAIIVISGVFALAMPIFLFLKDYLEHPGWLSQDERENLLRIQVEQYSHEHGLPIPVIAQQRWVQSAVPIADQALTFWQQRREQALLINTRVQGYINYLSWHFQQPEVISAPEQQEISEPEDYLLDVVEREALRFDLNSA